MRHESPGHREASRGYTLIEMAITCILMVIIFGAGLSLSVETRDAWSHIYQDTGALQAGRDTLRRLATELAASNADHVTIIPGDVHDTLEYQVPVALNGEDVTWGADGTEDRIIRVSVVDGSLVRRVIDTADAVVGQTRLLVQRVDSLHEGQKGFEVSRVDTLCTIRLRVRAEQDGHVWRRQLNTGALLRN